MIIADHFILVSSTMIAASAATRISGSTRFLASGTGRLASQDANSRYAPGPRTVLGELAAASKGVRAAFRRTVALVVTATQI